MFLISIIYFFFSDYFWLAISRLCFMSQESYISYFKYFPWILGYFWYNWRISNPVSFFKARSLKYINIANVVQSTKYNPCYGSNRYAKNILSQMTKDSSNSNSLVWMHLIHLNKNDLIPTSFNLKCLNNFSSTILNLISESLMILWRIWLLFFELGLIYLLF
jgi:hypothetical protein